MKIKNTNWYGFDHTLVNQKFEGGLTFINDFLVHNEYYPVAVYRCRIPNTRKGHKKYLLLNGSPHYCIRGMTLKELNKWRYINGVHCLSCNDVIYSINRHHYNTCSCKGTFIDGGQDYSRTTSQNSRLVIIDLLQNRVTKRKIKKRGK